MSSSTNDFEFCATQRKYVGEPLQSTPQRNPIPLLRYLLCRTTILLPDFSTLVTENIQ